MNHELSSKDKAFEKERVNHRQQVRELEMTIRKLKEKEYILLKQLGQAKSKITEQEEWIERLLESVNNPIPMLEPTHISIPTHYDRLFKEIYSAMGVSASMFNGIMRVTQ